MAETMQAQNDAAGFTLIEIMIALVLLSIGVLSIASLQVAAVQGRASSFNITTGGAWAGEQAEQLMALNYTNADLADGAHPAVSLGDGGKYTASWVVSENTAAQTKNITLTVLWNVGVKTHSTQVSFMKAKDYE